ncbi:MAG: efflux RND transporter permease subunit [Gammaproteobacteria bacterium]|nr:efflux RND transporter permease subunit [Gammaproteobacteria bacterium]
MLNTLIRFSLNNRFLVLASALMLIGYGLITLAGLPVDVFPDLNRPTVTIMIEAPGLAPEEVETQVTFQLETVLNGAPGVIRVRSSSGIGLAVIWVEFDWDTDIWHDRQVVQERLNQAMEKLPPGVEPFMAPISSIMGEIMLIGLYGESVDPMLVRTIGDWVIRPRLLTVAGISQVTVMGGELKQYQVLADPEKLRRYGVTFEELEHAVEEANVNTGGGFVFTQNQEYLIRNLARIRTLDELEQSLVKTHDNVPIRIRDLAEVKLGPAIKRGDGSVNATPAVIMAIQKQPGADTRILSNEIDQALDGLRGSLPEGLQIEPDLFRQSHFIDAAIWNVEEALRDGAILVVIILFLFLQNFRTTTITLTAIPLSLLATVLVFKWFGLSINTMTLGGIAVAIGELVDDAIVVVENVSRRLRENHRSKHPLPALEVVFHASSEILNPIVFGTALVLLVFFPLFALSGIEGRLFTPLAVACIVSILMSLLVSLTVTPALSFILLPKISDRKDDKDSAVLRFCKWMARGFYAITMPYPKSVVATALILLSACLYAVVNIGSEFLPAFNEGTATINMLVKPGTSLGESNRLGTLAEKLVLSVPEVKSVGRRTGRAEQDEHAEGVNSSELDVDFWTPEEAEDPEQHRTATGRVPPSDIRPRGEVLATIRQHLEELPGIFVNIGQPISHRIDHLLSGVRAQVAVKITGPDLSVLRNKARQVEAAMSGIPGVVDLQVEQQVLIPQIRIRVKRNAATRYGFDAGNLVDIFETALNGKVISQVIEDQRFFDLVLWTPEYIRKDVETIRDLRLVSPSGAMVLLHDVADVVETPGPNQINRENVARRIVVFCNVQGRDLGSTVQAIQASIVQDVSLTEGYSITYGGQFESQQRATRLLLIYGVFALVAMFVLLYAYLKSANLVAQVMLSIPFAFIGSVAALVIGGIVTGNAPSSAATGWLSSLLSRAEPFSVASLIGFISLTGIASRNGILMISHYIHLMTDEGMPFSREMIIRGSQERVAPVFMTALTTGLALIPLVLAKGEAGKEILYPVALVVLGGLTTSTLMDVALRPTIFFNFARKEAMRVSQAIMRKRDSMRDDTSRATSLMDTRHP